MEEVKADLFRYIELFYNRKRLHLVLGYMSPVEYRFKYDGEKPHKKDINKFIWDK